MSKWIDVLITFLKNEPKFLEEQKENILSDYEEAVGFTKETRIGSKNFSNKLGLFMEKVWFCSDICKETKTLGLDGESSEWCFQIKNRFNTMKQSMAVKEILPMLEYAIKNNKRFGLLILIDKNKESRDIPLHEGCGLSGLKKVKGYDPVIHRWISDEKIYELLFEDEGIFIKKMILWLFSFKFKFLEKFN
jgi:hypothetical protein